MQQNNLNYLVSANSNSFLNIGSSKRKKKKRRAYENLEQSRDWGNLELIGSKPQRTQTPNSKC